MCAYVMDVCIGVCFIFDDTKKKKFFLSTSSAVSLFNNSGFPFGVSGILIVVYWLPIGNSEIFYHQMFDRGADFWVFV